MLIHQYDIWILNRYPLQFELLQTVFASAVVFSEARLPIGLEMSLRMAENLLKINWNDATIKKVINGTIPSWFVIQKNELSPDSPIVIGKITQSCSYLARDD